MKNLFSIRVHHRYTGKGFFLSIYLLTTARSFFFRMRVPQDLQIIIGKRELKKSLKTSDMIIAEQMAARYAFHAHDLFDYIRRTSMAKSDLFDTFTCDVFIKKRNSSIAIRGLKTDPSRPVAEEEQLLKQLLDRVMPKDSSEIIEVRTLTDMPPPPPATTGILLEDAIKAYCREDQLRKFWDDAYTKQVSESVCKLVRVLGNQHVSSLTRENAVSFFEIIQKLPRDINKSRLYRNASIEQILKMNISNRLAPQTTKDLMSRIRVFSTWLKTNKHSTEDLFEGLVIGNIGKRNRHRQSKDITRFSNDDLQRIFSTKVFTDHKFLHPYYFWLPLIALYSGMRMNEICQLCPEDIYEIDELLMMNVKNDCEESEGEKLKQKVKTDSSSRKVPVHPKLIELGFLDCLATRKPGVRYSLKSNIPPNNTPVQLEDKGGSE